MTVKVGISIITGDNPDGLRKALESTQNAFDYISTTIVQLAGADVSSSIEIAKEFNAIITYYEPKWEKPLIDDFSAARNLSWEALPEDCDWIFCLDSDDYLLDGKFTYEKIKTYTKPAIISTIVKYRNKTTVFLQHRIWSRGDAKWCYRIHENLQFKNISSFIDYDIIITHTRTDFNTSVERNREIVKDILAKDPTDTRSIFFQAETEYLFEVRNNKLDSDTTLRSIKTFEKLARRTEFLDYTKFKSNFYLGDYYSMKSRVDPKLYLKALIYCLDALKQSMDTPDVYYLIGRLLHEQKKYMESILWLEHALKLPRSLGHWGGIRELRTSLLCELLASCYHMVQDNRKALEYHSMARYYDSKLEKYDDIFMVY